MHSENRIRPIRLSVRTPDFHSGKRSSILLWATRTTDRKGQETSREQTGTDKNKQNRNIIYSFSMANHKSAKKRILQTETRRLRNRYYHKTARNAVKALRNTSDKSAAEQLFPKVSAMLDKLVKRGIIHKNKAGNLKSSLQIHVNQL